MSEQDKSTRVVRLAPRAAPTPARATELSASLRQLAEHHLRGGLGGLFERLDDALFDLAEKAVSNAEQMHYFDGMREIRKHRPSLERGYLERVGTALVQCSARGVDGTASPSTVAPAELSLIDDSELEENLAISAMVSKHESRFARALFSLGQRLALLGGRPTIADADNPLGPAALTETFRIAMRELPAEMRVKLLVYKLFDRHVLASLDTLYAQANRALADAGLLPQLQHEPARRPTADPMPTPAAAPGTATPASTVLDDRSAGLLDTLRGLLDARHDAAAAPGAPTQAAPSAGELLGALSLLQGQVPANLTTAAGTPTMDLAALGRDVAQLKAQLLGQVGALRGERSAQVAKADEDTIDLVAMLFEFILDDRNLPTRMQALLARLQIPYLKAALLDRHLFAQRQHPARRLLDQLADAAKGWSPEADRDGQLETLVASIVERLLHDFDDDLAVFERLGSELDALQNVQRRRAELAEQRAAESTRGRERLDQARRRAAQEILARISGDRLPPLIHGLLTRAWANHLVLVLLRHGDGSDEAAAALQLVDDLIALARPAQDAQGRMVRSERLPAIEQALRQGLANVAFPEHDIDRMLAQLREDAAREPADPASVSPREHAPLPIPASMTAVAPDDAREPTPPAPVDASEPAQRSALEHVLAMQPGSWIEFRTADTEAARAKLSWISPMSGRYLFVNRRGLKVADHAPQELAAALVAGDARILANQPLFDRAMTAIVDRLRQPGTPPNRE